MTVALEALEEPDDVDTVRLRLVDLRLGGAGLTKAGEKGSGHGEISDSTGLSKGRDETRFGEPPGGLRARFLVFLSFFGCALAPVGWNRKSG